MQSSPPFFVAGPPDCLQFYPCTTPSPPVQNFPQMYQTYNFQPYNGPVSNVVGEGDVTYIVLPDGTIQLFFLPATEPRCCRCLQNNASPGWNNNASNNGPWFIRSVNTNNVDRTQQQWLPPQPYGGYNDYNQNNFLPPFPEIQTNRGVKFHNDRCTSSEDIGYFCRAMQQRHEAHFPSKCSTSVQVSRDPEQSLRAVCDAPCKCPHNRAGTPLVFEGIYGRYYDSDTDGETRRGEKRKNPYFDSPCSSCERHSKRRKCVVSSDSDSSNLSSKEWQEQRKRHQKDYEQQRKERQKELKEREKEMKEREKKRKKRDKEFQKFIKESEKRRKETEKEEKQFRERKRKEREKREKELEKENRQNDERIKGIHLQDSLMDNSENICKPLCDRHRDQLQKNPRPDTQDKGCSNSAKCLLCKLSAAVSSLASFATTSSSTNPCGVECPKSYEKECKKLFDRELKRREAVRIKSEQSLVKLKKTEQKLSEQEINKRESECKKIEAEILKKIKSDQKKLEQEQIKQEKERRKGEEKLKKTQGKYGESKIGDTSKTNQTQQPDYLFNNPLVKRQSKDSELECSCTASLVSKDKTLISNKERPLQVGDISEHSCQGCYDYCNRARASGKASTTHVEQADKSNEDKVPKSILLLKCSQLCNTDINPREDSRKHCGVLCEGPTKANKEIGTHSEQANSGIFSDILKKFGIGIQCSKCPPPPPPPAGATTPCVEKDSQLSFEFVSCANDCNLTICGKTDPSCNPL